MSKFRQGIREILGGYGVARPPIIEDLELYVQGAVAEARQAGYDAAKEQAAAMMGEYFVESGHKVMAEYIREMTPEVKP